MRLNRLRSVHSWTKELSKKLISFHRHFLLRYSLTKTLIYLLSSARLRMLLMFQTSNVMREMRHASCWKITQLENSTSLKPKKYWKPRELNISVGREYGERVRGQDFCWNISDFRTFYFVKTPRSCKIFVLFKYNESLGKFECLCIILLKKVIVDYTCLQIC